jgi:hypothetical protein
LAEADKEWTAEGYVADDSLAELVSDYREALAIAEEKDATVEAIKERIKEQLGDSDSVLRCRPAECESRGQPASRLCDGTAAELKDW